MMVIISKNIQNLEQTGTELIHREKQERQATGTIVSDTLKALNVSISALPQRCQELLYRTATLRNELNVHSDSTSIYLLQTKSTLTSSKVEYEILELKQMNIRLQKEIERNYNFLEGLRIELKESRRVLDSQNLNPGNVHEFIKQMKQKLSSYEVIYEKAKAKFNKLQVPETILPGPLIELATRIAALKEEEMALKQRADDVMLARKTLHKLRRN